MEEFARIMKTNIQTLKKRAEELWKEHAHKRDKERCRWCGLIWRNQVHHIMSRSHKNTFYDTENSMLLCGKCHFRVSKTMSPEVYMDIMKQIIGEPKYNELNEKRKIIKQWDRQSLEHLINNLKLRIKELG